MRAQRPLRQPYCEFERIWFASKNQTSLLFMTFSSILLSALKREIGRWERSVGSLNGFNRRVITAIIQVEGNEADKRMWLRREVKWVMVSVWRLYNMSGQILSKPGADDLDQGYVLPTMEFWKCVEVFHSDFPEKFPKILVFISRHKLISRIFITYVFETVIPGLQLVHWPNVMKLDTVENYGWLFYNAK